MKKILYTISTLQRTGPALVLYGLIKNLDRNKVKPIIITLSKEKANSLKTDFEELGVEIICLNKKGINTFLLGAYKFRKIIKEINPDIIHVNGFRDILLAAFILPKKYKKCATVHCDWKIDYQLKYGRFIGLISYWLQKQALKRINIRIACSKMLADLLNKKYPNIHFDFVDNGVDTDKFFLVTDTNSLRKKLNLPLDKKIAIWAGSFIERKDPLTMVKVIKGISQDKYYFVFCGARGPLLDVCKEELKNRKDVLFTGYITNIAEYFQASDIYVSTSLSEGFHLTVYEAMACGMPVILTDIEVYKNLKNNSAVLFYNSKNNRDLTSKLTELLDNNYNKNLSIIAQETVSKNYSAHNMAINYMEVYSKLL